MKVKSAKQFLMMVICFDLVAAVMVIISISLSAMAFINSKKKPEIVAQGPQFIKEYVYVEKEEPADQTAEQEKATEAAVVFGTYEKPESIEEWIAGTDFKIVDCDLSLELQEYTYYIADQYNIDFSLLMAIMEQESRYQVDVVSRTGDFGLMQINERNIEWISNAIGLTDIKDPEQNIEAGAYVLWTLFNQYGDNVNMVLMAYNMGAGNAKKLWNDGIYESHYSREVLERQENINGNKGI